MYAFRKALKREPGTVQEISLPVDAKAVAFANRGGDPTIFFTTMRQARDSGEQRVGRFIITHGEGQVPDKSQYIGVAEFSGGQLLYHAWEADYAG